MAALGDTSKTAKNLAKQVARQMAREPLEILKSAGRQIGGTEVPPRREEKTTTPEISPQEKAKIESRGQRQLAALEVEIKDIQKKKEQEAAIEMKRQESLQAQKQQAKKELPGVPSKPSRRLFGFGPKTQAERQKTRVEKPLPPSG